MTPTDYTAARQRLGLSRAAFARELGLAYKTALSYEAGKHPVPRYVALAVAALCHGLPPMGSPAR